MKAAVFRGKRDIRVESVPDSRIREPTDAVVRITHACICGSDLWFYRGIVHWEPGWRTGHEWMGVVEEVGSGVRTVKPGDRVIAPFAFSDGTCESCTKGLPTSCIRGDVWGGKDHEGGQAEAIRAELVDGTLVVLPPGVEGDEALLKAILPLSDVMEERGEAAIGRVVEMTRGGAGSVLECVGLEESLGTAIGIARPGGTVGFVGVPNGGGAIDLKRMFRHNIALRGGIAPVRVYLPELLAEVVAGRLDPSPILDLEVDLDGVPAGYAAMDQRRAIKAMVRTGGSMKRVQGQARLVAHRG